MRVQQKSMKFNNVTQPTRNWLDLPSEITANILCRIGVVDILLGAQKVCTAWRKICKDPATWRVVYIEYPNVKFQCYELCKHVVDRSQGRLLDITIVDFRFNNILLYVADRCTQIKRLTVACCGDYMEDMWTESLEKLPLLEDLSLYGTTISKEAIETAGRYCSTLKTLKVNQDDYRFWNEDSDRNSIAMAIGQNLHELRHLELIGNPLSNEGLEMILDGCPHLESLDLRRCLFINLHGDLGKRCSQQITCLKLPYHSLKECPYIYKDNRTARDVDDESEEGSGSDVEFDDESESDTESDDEADIEYDEDFDDESDIGCDDESDMESDDEAEIERADESDFESDNEADIDCDEEFDDEADIESDEDFYHESDEEFDDESDDG